MSQLAPTSGILVIFGITGDLSRKKLLPALYHLVCHDLLPAEFEIIGITRKELTTRDVLLPLQAYIESAEGACDAAAFEKLTKMVRIVTMDMTKPADYARLRKVLDKIEADRGVCLNRLYYLSVPPTTYGAVVKLMAGAHLNTGCIHGVAQSRIMVEKPFGYDLTSAKALIADLKRGYDESQIYRIDHYLAKETAQNILVFRFANPIFAGMWDHRSISRIDILAAESIGIEGRVAFYESTGALRDFIQSHLLQLLALVTMEEPAVMDAHHIHAEKLKLLREIKAVTGPDIEEAAIRGQYASYREEVGSAHSYTETFASLELQIDNLRWQRVPIQVTTGKHLDRKSTELIVTFSDHDGRHANNRLVFRLQPNEGIAIELLAKRPGFAVQTDQVEMSFSYQSSFGELNHPDAYERVLIDGIRGDQTLFATSDEVLASWRVIDAVVRTWQKSGKGLIIYEAGSTAQDVLALARHK